MEWDISKNPQIYFNRVNKAVKALTRANITSNMNQLRDMARYHLKASGEFNAAVRKWENKAAVDKHGQTSKRSSQWNMHTKTNKTNLLQNNSKPMQWKSKQRQRKNWSQPWLKTTPAKWRHSSRAQRTQWRKWCNASKTKPPLQQISPK